MKAYFTTFGCKTNQYDSALIGQALATRGVELTSDPALADWVVVNTCAVTKRGEDKACQWVRRMGREHPEARVAVVGCSVEVSAERFRALPNVRLLLGTEEKFRLGEVLADLESGPESTRMEYSGQVTSRRAYEDSGKTALHQDRARAFVKIQDGCDNRCTYCIVPRTRGPERSRAPESILEEARALEDAGHREIVLTGIHIGRYGVDRGDSPRLSGLLDRLLRGTRCARYRLSSVEIGELDPPLLDLVASEPRVCRHLHVPLQHGSDSVLTRMGRWYTAGEFSKAVEELKARVPLLGLGSDLIVGFPGESEAEFEAGRCLVESLPFTYLHVFPFSPRPGTPAAGLGGHVPNETVRRRVSILREWSVARQSEFCRSLTGETLPVLLERELAGGTAACRADNYVRAYCDSPLGVDEFSLRVERAWRDGVRGHVEALVTLEKEL